MIEAAYLRVYDPADDTPRARPASGSGRRKVLRVDDRFVWGESLREDVFEAEWRGRRFVCPRRARLRMLEGVVAFRSAYPSNVLVPPRAVRDAAAELERLKQADPDARSQILTSPFHVPLRWFLAFRADEKEIYTDGASESVRYRTLVAAALVRVGRAIEVLDDAGFDDQIIEPVRDLYDWIERFPRQSLLELDYAGVGSLFRAGELVMDETAQELAESLQALEDEDFVGAGERYAAAASRWAEAQALTYVN